MIRKNWLVLLTLFAISSSSTCIAKAINYYDQPKAESKLLGTMDSESGVITIYKPKEGDWIKVADPRNGNVGWIKSSELGNTNFNLNVINGNNGNQTYHVIQFGNVEPVTNEQVNQYMKKMHERHNKMQQDMQKMMNDMMQDPWFGWGHFPMIMPIIVVPEKSITPAKQPSKISTQATTNSANKALQ